MLGGYLSDKSSIADGIGVYPADESACFSLAATASNASPPWGENRTWVYHGQMFFPQNGVYWFGENVDDASWVKIDGNVIINDAGWNNSAYGYVVVETAPCWLDFEARFFNGGGGAGAVAGNGWTTTKGFGYYFNPDITATSASSHGDGSTFTFPVDPGDGSLFRYNDGTGFADTLFIDGFPARYGEATPPYGTFPSVLEEGTAIDCSVTAAEISISDAERTICTGYVHSVKSPAGETSVFAAGAGTQYSYVHPGMESTLTWMFASSYSNNFSVASSADGLVKLGELPPAAEMGAWYDHGELVEVAAIAADNSRVFSKWTGDVPSGAQFSNPLRFAADSPRSIVANFGKTCYVAPNDGSFPAASDSNAGTADSPFATIAKGIAYVGDGGTVFLLPGVYNFTAQLNLTSATKLVGAGNSPEDVIFRGSATFVPWLMVHLNNPEAFLSNITFERHRPSSGAFRAGVVHLDSAGGTVEDCVVRNCEISYGIDGGLISIDSAAGTVRRCVITNNVAYDQATSDGFALCVRGGGAENCLIANNRRIYLQIPEPNRFAAVTISSGTIRNCTIVGNSNKNSGGVYISNAAARFVNCIIAMNRGDVPSATPVAAQISGIADYAKCFYNCVMDIPAVNGSCLEADAYELFRNPDAADFRLLPGAAAVDAGLTTDVDFASRDLDGAARVGGAAIDAGCYELDSAAAEIFVGGAKKSFVGDAVAFSAHSTSVLSAATYDWDFGDGTTQSTSDAATTHTYAAAGVYDVTVSTGGIISAARKIVIFGNALYVVSENPNAAIPYDTLQNAAATVQAAVDAAPEGAVVLVEEGTHKVDTPLLLAKNVTIRGNGKPENCTLTALAGGRTLALVYRDAKIEGLRFYNNSNSHRWAGGVSFDAGASGAIISNCVIENCKSYYGGAIASGIYVRGDGVLVTHCILKGNDCDDNGSTKGGTIAMEGDSRIENCLIANNVTALAAATLGRATQKAAAGVFIGNGKLVNCTITGNRSLNVGGVYALGGEVINCAIFGNESCGGAGVETASVYDCGSLDPAEVFFNCAADKFLINESCFQAEDLGLAADFVPYASSICVNRGMSGATAAAGDLAGNPRVSLGAIDIGCYELPAHAGIAADILLERETALIGEALTFEAYAADFSGTTENFTYSWNFGDGSAASSEACPTHVYSAAGDYTVTLSVGGMQESVTRTVKIRPAVIYVKEGNANAALPYDTEAKGAPTMESAISYACADGMTVIVCPGKYNIDATLKIEKAITVKSRGNDRDSVIIDAQSNFTRKRRVMELFNSGALVHSLTVQGGTLAISKTNPYPGGNIHIGAAGGIVSNCVIRNGGFTNFYSNVGEGVAICSLKGLVTHCIISNNICGDQNSVGGSGVYISAGRCANSLIVGNSQYQINLGNGTDVGPGNANCKGAVLMQGGELINCTVVGNHNYAYSGVYSQVANARVVNCIIAANTPRFQNATAAFSVHGNSNKGIFFNCVSDFENINPAGNCLFGTLEEINFVNPEAGDWSLGNSSIARDMGDNSVFGTPSERKQVRDLAGKRRVMNRTVDAGCFEGWAPSGTSFLFR